MELNLCLFRSTFYKPPHHIQCPLASSLGLANGRHHILEEKAPSMLGLTCQSLGFSSHGLLLGSY